MNEQLGMTLEPGNMTLADLKKKNLTRGASFDIIKSVSDVALKEFNITLALETIDKEIVEIGFTLVPYKGTKTKVIQSADVTLQAFEDCLIRCQAMKGNPFGAHQADRLARSEAELQYLIVVLNDWAKVQK